VFHFAEDEIGNGLRTFPVDESTEETFVMGRGVKDQYYLLADVLAVGTWLGIPLSHSELGPRLRALMVKTSTIAAAFLEAGESLVLSALGRLGFVRRGG